MSIFNIGDICRDICGYLSFDDMCMFRRCNRALHTYISGNYFYDRKTKCLSDLLLRPSDIMGVTRDVGYRRYCKKKQWRAICPNYRFHSLTHVKDIRFVRYLLKTKGAQLSRQCLLFNHLIPTKDRRLIDSVMKLTPENHLINMFLSVLHERDEELILWFEEKHIGDKLEQIVLEGHTYTSIWKRYYDRYPHCFGISKDPATGRYRTEEVVFALKQGRFVKRVHKNSLNLDIIWNGHCYTMGIPLKVTIISNMINSLCFFIIKYRDSL